MTAPTPKQIPNEKLVLTPAEQQVLEQFMNQFPAAICVAQLPGSGAIVSAARGSIGPLGELALAAVTCAQQERMRQVEEQRIVVPRL